MLSRLITSDSMQPTVAHQALLSMGFFRQQYWSGLPFPFPGDSPNSGIEPVSPTSPELQADSLLLSHRRSTFTNLEYRKRCKNRLSEKLFNLLGVWKKRRDCQKCGIKSWDLKRYCVGNQRFYFWIWDSV